MNEAFWFEIRERLLLLSQALLHVPNSRTLLVFFYKYVRTWSTWSSLRARGVLGSESH